MGTVATIRWGVPTEFRGNSTDQKIEGAKDEQLVVKNGYALQLSPVGAGEVSLGAFAAPVILPRTKIAMRWAKLHPDNAKGVISMFSLR